MPFKTSTHSQLLRRQNGERISLERDLSGEESLALEKLEEEQESKRRQLVNKMSSDLAEKMRGEFCGSSSVLIQTLFQYASLGLNLKVPIDTQVY